MYESFFGLNDKPFTLLPDPDFLFLSSKHAVALSMLEYSMAGQAGFCAITGDVGSGKTTIIRTLLRRIGRDITIGLISNTHSGHTDIAAWALAAFGQSAPSNSESDIYQALMHFLISEYGAGRRCALVVDEAQNLTIESLEELRLLSNINSDKDLLLQILLVGQPELLEKLKRPDLRQFAQRISVSYHLGPLSFDETKLYINHRLTVAGASRAIFSDMAIGGIQYFSGGVPRLINSICDMALVYCFADAKEMVDLDMVLRVVGDRQASGVAGYVGVGHPKDPEVIAGITGLVDRAKAAKPQLPKELVEKSRTPQVKIKTDRRIEPVLTTQSSTIARPQIASATPRVRVDMGQGGAQRHAGNGVNRPPAERVKLPEKLANETTGFRLGPATEYVLDTGHQAQTSRRRSWLRRTLGFIA